jgi:hypothetical protein
LKILKNFKVSFFAFKKHKSKFYEKKHL